MLSVILPLCLIVQKTLILYNICDLWYPTLIVEISTLYSTIFKLKLGADNPRVVFPIPFTFYDI